MKEWSQFLEDVELKKPGSKHPSWLSHYKIASYDSQNLYLNFTDIFALNFFKEHIGPELVLFKNSNNHRIKVHIKLESSSFYKSGHPDSKSIVFKFPEDKQCMFSNFVKDKENHFVFDLLNHLPENTPTFNPLFIYGAHNSGKSHLLKAAFNHYQALGLKCLYVDAETFSEHVIYAMKNQAMNEFRKTYRICDMLFFDDVHKLAHKTATQEEFFHTFNSLQMATKSIVMASLTPASFLKDIEPRLISRFEWGLSIELPVLNKEHFPVLINTLSGSLGLDISKENKKTLLENFSLDPGSLIKAIHAISLRSHLDQDHSEKHAQVTLDDLKNQKKELTADDITLKTSNFFGLKPKDIRGPSQTKPLAFPRQLTMYLIRKHLNLPYKKMGEYFSRDHSTVMASITIIDQKLKNFEEETMNAVKRIEWDLKN